MLSVDTGDEANFAHFHSNPAWQPGAPWTEITNNGESEKAQLVMKGQSWCLFVWCPDKAI